MGPGRSAPRGARFDPPNDVRRSLYLLIMWALRRLFDLIAGASLLALIAVCVLWVRSYRFTERVDWSNAGGGRSIRSAVGYVEVSLLLADWSKHPNQFHGPRYQRDLVQPPFNYMLLMCSSVGDTWANYQWRGFEWNERRNRIQGVLHARVVAPMWSLASLAGLPPLGWGVARMRRRVRGGWKARGPGFCRGCGYDLRATPQRCPECGLAASGGA